MMLELVQVLLFAILCSSTQGDGTAGILVKVTEECFSDVLVFQCTDEIGYLVWDIRTITGLSASFTFRSTLAGTTETRTLNSSSIVGQVTFNNGSFINATVTIMRPINLNGSMIRCNNDMLTLIIPTGTLPTALNISLNENTRMLDIYLNSIGNVYCIQSSAHPSIIGTWNHVTNASYTLPLMNTTYTITISPLSDSNMVSNFTIGPCLFHDPHTMERSYTLYQNDSWTVECDNSIMPFHTSCDSNGSWNMEIRCPAMTEQMSTAYTTYMTTMGIKTSRKTTEHLFHTENPLNTNLVASLVPVVAVLTTVVLIPTIILLYLIRKKIKKKSSIEYPNRAETSEMTYQSLSNKHYSHKPNISGRQSFTANIEMHDQGEYSSLHHNKPFLPSNEEYDTVHQSQTETRDLLQYGSLETKNTTSIPETTNGHCSASHLANKKTKYLKYTDIDTSDHNGPMGLNLINIKVDYADINLQAHPEDETLNLDSLLIQLNPMSKDFRLFGSVAGISPDTLDKIVASSAAPYDGLVEVCDAWLDKCRKEKTTPTWNAVADILSLIGRDKLSHDIMQVYTTGKLPIEVDMNSLDVQGEVRLPSPPPIPPHRDEGNEDTGSEVELMTVTSVMTSRQLPASRDTAMEEPPPIPEKLHDIMPAEVNEELHQTLPELPPKLPVKEQQRKPIPAKRKQSKDDEVMPSLPPRPPKNAT